MLVMTVFGGAALLLAAIGIYGLMAYSVQQQTQEIGIRLALGAETGQVWKMVVVQGMRLVVVGVVIGLASASGLARFIASFLFEVGALDPTSFIAVPDRARRRGHGRRDGAGASRQPGRPEPRPSKRITDLSVI